MFQKSIDQLTADISKWADKTLSLIQRRREAGDRISVAELSAGNAILDAAEGESTSLPVEEVVRARAEVNALAAAMAGCRIRLLDAKRAKRQADASELRKQASDMRADIARIEQKVRKHIDSINALQETQVTVSVTAPGEPPAKSQLLETQAMAIEARAAALGGELPRHGTVTLDNVTSIEPLIASVLNHASDGPPASDIARWAAAVEQRAIAGRRGEFGQSPRRYRLVWRDGQIDLSESHIQVHALARRTAGPISGAPVFELGSDLFYAQPAHAGL